MIENKKEDQEFLWENIEFIDIIASDHAPHTREEKSMDPSPNGIPGLETTLPLLLNAINDGRLMINDLKRMCCDRPKEIFNILIAPLLALALAIYFKENFN